MILETIRAVRVNDGFSFVATLKLDGNRIELPVPVETLTSYFEFQKLVLLNTGRMLTLAQCEGRDPWSANAFWHEEVDFLLNQSVKAAATSSKTPPVELN